MNIGSARRTTPPKRVGRRGECIFCGASPTTKEDIFPKWIHRYLGQKPTISVRRDATTGTGQQVFRTLSYIATARRVCSRCNNGWMSDLEEEASDLLKPMFDERITIHLAGGDGQHLVARWAMKTALMLQFTHQQQCIPLAVYKEFFKSGLPPKKVVIYVAHHLMQNMPNGAYSLNWDVGINRADGSVDLQGEMYGITFFIKNVVAQGVGYLLKTAFDPNVEFDQTFQPYVQLLWPPGRGVIWPPGTPSLDDRQLLAFAQSLAKMKARSILRRH